MAIWACAADAAPPSSSASETVPSRDFMVMGISSGFFVKAYCSQSRPNLNAKTGRVSSTS